MWKPLRKIVLILSLGVFLLASLGKIDTYPWGYCLFPGTIYIFITGMHIYAVHHGLGAREAKKWIAFAAGILGTSLVWFASLKILDQPHTFEIILGFFLSLIAISVLGEVKTKNVIDEYLGKLSYPLFISHFFVIWVLDKFLKSHYPNLNIYSVVVFKLLVILPVTVIVYHAFDAPSQVLRKKLQRKRT